MYIEIKDKTESDPIFDSLYPWRKDGFFVATVGKEAYSYLSGRVFSLHDLDCCSPAAFVNVIYYSDYKRWIDDDNEALQRMEADTKTLAKSCKKKQLYVLSEAEDLYTANQCCELANNTGEEGFSILITHKQIKGYPYFAEIKKSFDHIIFLPDEATYTTEILKWIICGFTESGFIGVDFDDARSVLTRSSESDCRKIKYNNVSDVKKSFNDFLAQVGMSYNAESEVINRLLGVWVPHDFDLDDVIELHDAIKEISQGDIIITGLFNEHEDDKSWTVSLLSAVSKKSDNE